MVLTPALWRVGVMDEAIRSATIIAAARLVVLMSGLFMALVPMSAQSAEGLQGKPRSHSPMSAPRSNGVCLTLILAL